VSEGADDGQACGPKSVGDPLVERGFRAHDRQGDLIADGQGQEGLHVGGLDSHTLGHGSNSGVPRGAKDPGDLGVLGQPPDQGMLPAPSTHDKDVHEGILAPSLRDRLSCCPSGHNS